MVCCLGMLGCVLGMILVVDARQPKFFEFWFLRMPFSIHAGWLIVASAVNINVWLTKELETLPPAEKNSELFAAAMISLSFIFVMTALFGVNTRRPDFFLILPVAWGLYWILEFQDPPENPWTEMPNDIKVSVRTASRHCLHGVVALAGMSFL